MLFSPTGEGEEASNDSDSGDEWWVEDPSAPGSSGDLRDGDGYEDGDSDSVRSRHLQALAQELARQTLVMAAVRGALQCVHANR